MARPAFFPQAQAKQLSRRTVAYFTCLSDLKTAILRGSHCLARSDGPVAWKSSMSRIEYAAVLDSGTGSQGEFSQPPPAMPAGSRRLQHALADLGPGRPLPPPTMPKRASPAKSTADCGFAPPVDNQLPQVPTHLPPVWSAEDVTHSFEAEDGPPPMLIERARTAQMSGQSAEHARSTPSYWPGVIGGFSLSLMIGGALLWSLI